MSTSELTPYEQAIADSWTDTHKKSALMLLILLALSREGGWSGSLKEQISLLSGGHLAVDDQSLHRALRRAEGLNLIVHREEAVPGSGLKRKLYELTQSGERVLRHYLRETMSYVRHPLFQEQVATLL